MDKALCFSRTEKGRAELIGSQHALKPKQRQVLFMVADNVSLATLSAQLPNCTELETIVQYLWDEGYIGLVSAGGTTGAKTNVADALALISTSRLEAARQHELTYLAPIVGEQSPVLQRIRAAQDTHAFSEAVVEAKKLVAAVASAAKALAFESGVMAILNLPKPPAAQSLTHNGIESARARALEIVAALIGTNSPAYTRLQQAGSREQFVKAVKSSRRILAAAASASRAAAFESEVMGLLGG